jgi:hypothetical protein
VECWLCWRLGLLMLRVCLPMALGVRVSVWILAGETVILLGWKLVLKAGMELELWSMALTKLPAPGLAVSRQGSDSELDLGARLVLTSSVD